MDRTEHAAQDDLCSNSNKLVRHMSTCHNPSHPVKNDASPKWDSVVAMNIELMQKNYSVVQPDVVLYGDSITEHLLGRNFGHFGTLYEETAALAATFLRKREGGRINGLPVAVSGDQVGSTFRRALVCGVPRFYLLRSSVYCLQS